MWIEFKLLASAKATASAGLASASLRPFWPRYPAPPELQLRIRLRAAFAEDVLRLLQLCNAQPNAPPRLRRPPSHTVLLQYVPDLLCPGNDLMLQAAQQAPTKGRRIGAARLPRARGPGPGQCAGVEYRRRVSRSSCRAGPAKQAGREACAPCWSWPTPCLRTLRAPTHAREKGEESPLRTAGLAQLPPVTDRRSSEALVTTGLHLAQTPRTWTASLGGRGSKVWPWVGSTVREHQHHQDFTPRPVGGPRSRGGSRESLANLAFCDVRGFCFKKWCL